MMAVAPEHWTLGECQMGEVSQLVWTGREVARLRGPCIEALWSRLGGMGSEAWTNRRGQQCVFEAKTTSDALRLRIALPTCASPQPPARSCPCPVLSVCFPRRPPSSFSPHKTLPTFL